MRGFQQNGVCLKDRIEDNADRWNGYFTIDRCKQATHLTRALRDWEAESCLITNALTKWGCEFCVGHEFIAGWGTQTKEALLDYDPTASNRRLPAMAFV